MPECPSTAYLQPLDDIWFVLREIVDLPRLAALPCFEHPEPELLAGVLTEAARFVAEVIAPLNRIGDEQHSRREADGTVTTPDGFTAAYQQYVAAGWGSVPFPAEYGGGGFPWLVATDLSELMADANLTFSLRPTLTRGAIELILAHGDNDQRGRFLPPLGDGRVDRNDEPHGARCRLRPGRHPHEGRSRR